VVIACAATLHAHGTTRITDASQAAQALEPLAGNLSATLFGAGLLGAALLAAAILPLSTAYSVSEALGVEARIDDHWREARVFYTTYGLVLVVSVAIILIPGAPLVPILFLSQVLNAVLLLPLLVFIRGLARDPEVMGPHALGAGGSAATLAAITGLTACLGALLALTVLG
jgi:Mn2+/Fe2+ NRAMP family transporter